MHLFKLSHCKCHGAYAGKLPEADNFGGIGSRIRIDKIVKFIQIDNGGSLMVYNIYSLTISNEW